MDSRAKMLIGLIVCFVGAFVTYITYSAASGGGRFIVAWGAIAVGAGTFLAGLVQYITADSSGQVDRALPTATPEFKALLRAMISASEIDGPLDADKIHTIRDMAFKITKTEPYANTIKDVSAGMAKERARGIKTSDYLAQVQSDFTLEVKQLVLRTSATLLTNGNTKPERASQFIHEMATALGLTEQQRQAACRA
jgi:uncharacterized membrane protein YebE (DUF533 family)